MNEKIKALDPEKILFWDVETASYSKELVQDSPEADLFEEKNKDKSTGEILPFEELKKLYDKKAALSPTFARITCISMGFIKSGKMYIKTLKGEEKDIIENFYKSIPTGYVLAGYNSNAFDIPMVRIRALKYNLQHLIPENQNDSAKKSWNLSEVRYSIVNVDLMDMYRGTYYMNLSLSEACYICGIPTPKDGEITGATASKAFYEGRIDEIVSYCERDTIATINLFLKMTSRPIIEEVIIRKDETEEELKPIQINILELLYTNKEFNDEVKIKVKEHLSKVKLTKKDLINVELMLYSLYINTKMFQSDKPELLEEKKKEISEFVKSIK